MINKKVILSIIAVLVCLIGTAALFVYIAVFHRHSSRLITENIPVSNDWIEIAVQPSLEIDKQIQSIGVTVEGARFNTNTKHNQLPNGSVIDPEVHLKDSDGRWHVLHGGAGTVTDYDSNTQTFAAKSIYFTLHRKICRRRNASMLFGCGAISRSYAPEWIGSYTT